MSSGQWSHERISTRGALLADGIRSTTSVNTACVFLLSHRYNVDDMCKHQWAWASKYPQGYDTPL